MNFPKQFDEPVRPDLITRAVLAIRSKRAAYGANTRAGKENSSKLSRRRRAFKTPYGRGVSRVPRKTMTRRGTQMHWVGARAPQTRGGMQAHPPRATKNWEQAINRKERRKAIRSALAATIDKTWVAKRGHKLPKTYPLIAPDTLEDITKAKTLAQELSKLGIDEELARASQTKIRAGRGKSRGRRVVRKRGPLIVVSDTSKLLKMGNNLPGVDIVAVTRIHAEHLAPGTHPGRMTIYTKKALSAMEQGGLYL